MEKENNLEWSNLVEIIEHNNIVLLANTGTGEWLQISKRYYDILEMGIRNNFTYLQYEQQFTKENDKMYIRTLLNSVLEASFLLRTKDKDNKTHIGLNKVYFGITNRCNLRCAHCCYNAVNSSFHDKLSTQETFKVLDKIISLDPSNIIISGGEPMLRKDFLQIISYVRRNFRGRITLMTNGTFITEENIDILIKSIDTIDFSLDGVNEESCALIRGKGVFNKVVNSIKLLQSNNFYSITVSMVLTNENNHLENEFLNLNKELNTTALLRVFSPLGRGRENKEKLQINDKLNKENVEELVISNREQYRSKISCYNCSATKKILFVDYDGSIYPCGMLTMEKYKVGNIFEIEDLPLYLSNDMPYCEGIKNLKEIFPYKFVYCKDCKVNLFCWHCLGIIESMRDDRVLLERHCKENKEILYKLIWKD